MKKVLFVVVLAAIASQSAFAAEISSTGQNGNWNDNATWDDAPYVTGADNGYLLDGTTVTVDATSEQALNLQVNDSTLNVTNNGSLSIAQDLKIGNEQDWVSTGVVNVDSGSTLSTGGNLEVGNNGNGILNINGGQVTVEGDLSAPNPRSSSDFGQVNIFDGILTINGSGMNSSGQINIADGELRILGEWRITTISQFDGKGIVIGNLGNGDISLTLDGDYTVVRTSPNPIPEPMTISLLGLGAMGLLRKKRTK